MFNFVRNQDRNYTLLGILPKLILVIILLKNGVGKKIGTDNFIDSYLNNIFKKTNLK